MKKKLTLMLILMISILFIGCSNKNSDTPIKVGKDEVTELTISAAVSLTDALEEIKTLYEKENAVELTFNLGGSGMLAQQIQQGAPSDLFISANQQWMDTLEVKDLIKTGTRTNVTGNKLVLITNNSSPIAYQSFEDISPDDINKIAIGNPESVPAGKYTEETLQNLNLWDLLEAQLVLAKDVRQVLTYVESENAEIGFVYASDALSTDEIKILATADDGLHKPIIYPMAVITDTKHGEEAVKFTNFMETDKAQDILMKYGFKK